MKEEDTPAQLSWRRRVAGGLTQVGLKKRNSQKSQEKKLSKEQGWLSAKNQQLEARTVNNLGFTMPKSTFFIPGYLLVFTLLITATILGCDGGGDGDADAGEPEPTPEEVCDAQISTICQRIEECQPVNFDYNFTNTADCEARFFQDCPSIFSLTGSSYTTTAQKACTEAQEAQSCAELNRGDTPEVCESQPGSLTNGSVCGYPNQCASNKCKFGDDPAACGTCGDPIAVGGACVRSGDCDGGLYCNEDDTCVALASAGDSCADRFCGGGTVCRSGGTCGAPLAAGATCEPMLIECDSAAGLWCNNTSAVCQAVQLANAGAPCGLLDGGFTLCRDRGYCRFDDATPQMGTCIAVANDGNACSNDDGPNCRIGSECINGVCSLVSLIGCQ